MSTVPEVITALRQLFSATFDPAEVQVTVGNRTTVSGPIRIDIGDVTGDAQPEALGPTRPMQEEYDVACTISATVNGSVDDQEPTALAVLTLFEGCEHAVRSSPGQNLGVPDVMWAGVIGRFELRHTPASETGGPINASFTFNVHVRALYRLN